ncbi:MAG: hypothetical protein WCL32_06935 [Planctomycetota bacterium]
MKRIAIGSLLALALAVVAYFALRGQSFWTPLWTPLGPGRVKAVPAGDQEIAWIASATSGEAWERLVKAVRVLAEQWEEIHGGAPMQLDTERAFLPLTADVPEIGLHFPKSGTLWIRWYKLSAVTDAQHWVHNLKRRATPPLAIVGGDTSDRALVLAEILERVRNDWSGPPPLLLITTATAERYLPPGKPELELDNDDWPRLMAVYPGRSFRFAFTNTLMVEAMLDFVQQNPKVWPPQAKVADPKGPPFSLFTLTWLDDGYSKDLANSFRKLFFERYLDKFKKDAPFPFDENSINYSVGDYYQPNPREEMAVGLFLGNAALRPELPQLLVLPTGTQRARRFLRTLCRRSPSELDNIVVANGDSISFNSLYRDRDVAWNVQDMPVPLIVFCHRNPIDPASGFGGKPAGSNRPDTTSTQDLLLFRDLIEAVVLASFRDGELVANSDQALERLRGVLWRGTGIVPGGDIAPGANGVPFFDAEGNRTAGTGEHIVWLKPFFDDKRVLPEASLSVYQMERLRGRTLWQRVGEPLPVLYDRSAEKEAVHDAR